MHNKKVKISFFIFDVNVWSKLLIRNAELKFLIFTLSVRQTKIEINADSVDSKKMVCKEPSHQDLCCLPFCF